MAASGFEWFVAWRHLREEPSRRSPRTMIVGLVLLAVGGGWLALARFGPAAIDRLLHIGPWLEMRTEGLPYLDWLKGAAVGAIGLGLLLTILGGLFASFTVFTAISIFGVFLGTGAPIIALSVMSGFEADLKSKIRATKADVVISAADDRAFTDWKDVQEKIAPIKGVVDSMAYIESEVIVKHASNPAGMGIILRGIDATRAPRVLDLARKMSEGKVEYLITPDKIPPEDVELIPGAATWGLGADSGEATSGASPRGAAGGETHKLTPGKRGEAGEKGGKGDKGTKGGEADTAPAPSPPGILLGEELYARTLHVFVGSDVDVACPMCGVGPTGPMPRMRSFRVAGHFYTGMYEFDSKLAYVSLAEAQKFLGMQGEVTGVEVRTVDPDRARDIASRDRGAHRPRVRGAHLGGAESRPVHGAAAREDRDVRGADLHRAGRVVLDRLEPDHAGDREGEGGRDLEVDGRARRRHPARLLRRGALHRARGVGAGGHVRRHRLPAAGALRPADRP